MNEKGTHEVKKSAIKKPRTKLCWLCGRKFWGYKHKEIEIDGHLRELHIECAESPDWAYAHKVSHPEESLYERYERGF